MLFALLYACLRLFLDVIELRVGGRGVEAEVLLLRHELRVLRRQVNRLHLEPADRAIIAALVRLLRGSERGSLLVKPETVLGWHRELVRRKWAAFGRRRGVGRPGLAPELRELILEMARSNPRWGCVRIRGELFKLGHRVSATAIRNLLRRNRIGPAPLRSAGRWREFLQAQASAIVVSDFFSVDTVFLKRLYVLVYLELASRRVLWWAITENPDAGWVAQQARNLVWELEERGVSARFLIRDNDAKFGGGADAVVRSAGLEVIRTPIAAPRANAVMERQIGSTRRECLDWLLILSRRHLERVMKEWVEHYNRARPHRALGLATPVADPARGSVTGAILCNERLGGLLHEYSRAAAPAAA